MAKPNFTLPNKPAIKSGSILSYNYTDDFTFVPAELSFSRNGDATVVNSKNLIETVSANTPRIDYSDSLTEPSLLLEPQSTNLFPYSEDFENSDWTKNAGTTITNNYAISPDGTQTAARYLGTGSSGLGDKFTLSAVGHTVSFWVKSNNGLNQFCRLIGDSSQVSSDILVTTEWNRISYTFTASGLSNKTSGIFRDSSNNDIDILIWGAQLEQQSYATSYIPTAGATATRLGETATNAGDVNVFNSEEGVLYAEIAALANDSTYKQFTLNAGSPNDSIRLMYTDVNNQVRYFVRRSASTQVDITYTLTDATQFNKIAMVYKANDFQLWVNGIKVGTDTSGTPPSGLSTIDFNDGGTSSYFYGNVKNVQVFNKALTDRELEILTIQ